MLKYCTLTGVDAHTDIAELATLAVAHPYAEFGMLLSRTRCGVETRYPLFEQLVSMVCELKERVPAANTALHVCGRAVNEFVMGNHDVRTLAERFDRVQLNFAIGRVPFSMGQLERAIAGFGKPVITQHNTANVLVADAITAPNHHVLYDASGGEGIRAARWQEPIAGKFCGYAGGIGPDTVAQDVSAVSAVTSGKPYWIDMENRLRTDDVFDLGICRQVLDAVSTALASQPAPEPVG